MDWEQLKGETVQVELVNGLEVVGKFIEVKEDTFHLKRAFKVLKMRVPNEPDKVMMQWLPFIEKDIYLYKHAVVMLPVKCNEQISAKYLQATSNLTIPGVQDVSKFKMGENK